MYTKSFNTKKTWLGAMFTFALLAIMGLTFAFKPFSNQEVKPSKAIQTWYFHGTVLADDKLEANYTGEEPENCGTGSTLPCEISFDANDYQLPTTKTPLQNYLDSKTDEQIRVAAVSRKTN